ncbi:MAG TPA: hypothetical protein VIW73_02570 [Candidatus Cybelea sp.]
MKLFSYVVTRDYGFAPNPFSGYCTLATCKPDVRSAAAIGDWIVGTGRKANGFQDHLVYAMRVTEALTFEQYWNDPRFLAKRVDRRGSRKRLFGDNVYHRNPATGHWVQEDSHHSRGDGTAFGINKDHDTQTDRVLISDDFVYFGGSAIALPPRFRGANRLRKKGQGHRSNFTNAYVERVVVWLRSLGVWGFRGRPALFREATISA